MKERARGWVLIVVSLVGLAAEITSTVQDGIGAAKVVTLACFAFLFWWGWELAHRVPPEGPD